MRLIERLQGAHALGRAPGALPSTQASAGDQGGFFSRFSEETRPRGRILSPLNLLLVILAAAAIGLHPSVADLCGRLDDFPCGP
jgi:hypothetical protein